jgi:3-deoxy-manno-octulosonate cytidylyltransferase (CMP-KDO synthetase)
MSPTSNPIVIIPARLASTRLPNKPLADIGGAPMIVQVVRRAKEAALGPVVVAAGDLEIVEAVEKSGGRAIMTDPDLPSGSDRIWAALQECDREGMHDVVINLQGDLPTISKGLLQAICEPLKDPLVDISTLVAEISDPREKTDPNVCKAIVSRKAGAPTGQALYFTRATAPTGDGPLYHHIGIYGYRRAALERFVGLEPSPLERRERLEQLRALEAGMTVGVRLVNEVPAGVDTQEDLERARNEISRFE